MKDLSKQLPTAYPPAYATSGEWQAKLESDNENGASFFHASQCWTIQTNAYHGEEIPNVAVAVCFREADAKLIATASKMRDLLEKIVECAESRSKDFFRDIEKLKFEAEALLDKCKNR